VGVEVIQLAALLEAGERPVDRLQAVLDPPGDQLCRKRGRHRRADQHAHARAEQLEAVLVFGCGHHHEVRVVTGVSGVAEWPAVALTVWRVLVAFTVATRLLSALM
jgi:hypothetical protein